MAQHALAGLRATPYASYLGAVGLLKILARQADASSQMWMSGGHFHLRTAMGESEVLEFLLQRYEPSPVLSPWNQETGFYSELDGPLGPLERSAEPRFAPFRRAISAGRAVVSTLGLAEAPTGESKTRLVQSCFASFPAEAQPWLRAVFRESGEGLEYSRLLFTGGNDGRFDLSRQFALSLADLFFKPASTRPHSLLRAVLYDDHTRDLQRATHGFLNPATCESMTAQSGGKAWQQGNPWALVLAVEGLVALAPSLDLHTAAPAGQPSLRPEEKSRGDLWLPLWSDPLALDELPSLFCTKAWPALQRFSIVARNGRAHFAIPAQGQAPRDAFWRRPAGWLPNAKAARLWHIIGQQERDPRPTHLASLLEELGALAEPDWQLDSRWLKEADDGTAEYALALALSGLGSDLDKKLRVRSQLSHFQGPDLSSAMMSLMRRRDNLARTVTKRKNRAGILLYNSPFWSRYPAAPEVINAFLRGQLDEQRVHRLFRGLAMVQQGDHAQGHVGDVSTLPWLYRVAKLACHSDGVDRRPSPPDLALLLAQGRYDQAARMAVNFVALRHEGFPRDLPPISYRGDPWRLAASLLIPISNTTYDAILRSLQP